ncbi:MAG: replicative DNA helicase [Clostridiaceae bacterium]|jgi:replicative DNA helicase|nr:replicative DNA helicase [Clostridiaceae bacterium]
MSDNNAKKTRSDAGANGELRAMPKRLEAEQAVLGAMLIDGDAADSVLTELREGDFYDIRNALIFATAKRLQERNKPVDTVTVIDSLDIDGKLEDAGGVAYIGGLANSIPSAANNDYYSDIVRRYGVLREIIRAGNQIVRYIYEETPEETDAIAMAEKAVFNISESRDRTEFVSIADAGAAAIEEIEKIQKNRDDRNITRSGFNKLDTATGGFKPGDFVLLAARPSVGKTAFALNFAANAALNQHKSVAIFSLEMPTVQLVKRMLSYTSNVSLSKMGRPQALSTQEFAALLNAHKSLSETKIFINDSGMITPSEILSKCRRLKRGKSGLDLVIIDYLQLMKMRSGSGGDYSRQQEVSDMSRMMKIYAKELGVPFFVLSQMSRGVEQRNEHEPKLSDLRESGAIEQDADMVMFLFKPYQYDKNQDPNDVTLVLGKNRNGPLVNIPLHWDGEKTAFSEKEESSENGAASYRPQGAKPPKPSNGGDDDDGMPFTDTAPKSAHGSDAPPTYSADSPFAAEEEDDVKAKNKKNSGKQNQDGLKKVLAAENVTYGGDAENSPFKEVVSEELILNGAKKSLREPPFDGSKSKPNSVLNEPGDQEIDELKKLAKKDLPF